MKEALTKKNFKATISEVIKSKNEVYLLDEESLCKVVGSKNGFSDYCKAVGAGIAKGVYSPIGGLYTGAKDVFTSFKDTGKTQMNDSNWKDPIETKFLRGITTVTTSACTLRLIFGLGVKAGKKIQQKSQKKVVN